LTCLAFPFLKVYPAFDSKAFQAHLEPDHGQAGQRDFSGSVPDTRRSQPMSSWHISSPYWAKYSIFFLCELPLRVVAKFPPVTTGALMHI
jgi:hypothetical protein